MTSWLRRLSLLLGISLLASWVPIPATACRAGWCMTHPASAAAKDSIRDMQWYLSPLRIPEAQALTRGDGVVVAVIEDGVDANHPDLVGQVLPGRGFGSDAGSDGRTDRNPAGHGTCMAGIIAARGGSADRTLGIAPGAKILPVSVGVADSPPATIADGIRWAVDNGADVINMSFGRAAASQLEQSVLGEAVRYALGRNVVVVASAGNVVDEAGNRYPENDVFTPGDIPGVIAVASTDKSASHDPLSVHGPQVVVGAPGIDIVCPTLRSASGPRYGSANQSSPAAAIVSGVVALIRAKYPQLDAMNVINRLLATVKDQGDPGRDEYFGFGTIRPYDALTANVPAVEAWPLPTPAESVAAGGGNDNDEGLPILVWIGAAAVLVVVLVVIVVAATRRRR